MNIVVVYNAASGSGFTKMKLKEMTDVAGITVIKWVPVADQFEKQLMPHIHAGKIIAVVGGDGTQRAVAALAEDTNASMAPLPGGTLNHFTKDLGVPQDMAEAIARLPKLKATSIDTASVNDNLFVNNSSIGLYPSSLLEREKTERIFGKWPAAIRATIRTLIRFRRYVLTVNGQTVRSPFIFLGNSTYKLQKSMLAERSSLTDDTLTLFVLRSSSRLGLVRAALFDRFTAKKRTDQFIIDHLKEVVIEAKATELTVSMDGEVMKLKAPLIYKIHPKSLKVLV